MSLLPHFACPVRVIDLEQPRRPDMPVIPQHRPGHAYFLHRRHEDTYRPDASPRSGASGVMLVNEHSGTHIDALCHQAEDLVLFNGVPVAEAQRPGGFTTLGVEEIPPIVARGVLLDLPRHRGVEQLPPGTLVGREELDACARASGLEIGRGDVVLVRTGNGRNWDDPERYLAGPGMAGSASTWLAEHEVLAVGADNMAWDALGVTDPELGFELPGHVVLIARNGIYILENLALEELAAAERVEFSFVCAPLKVVGATGSPVRPLALVAA